MKNKRLLKKELKKMKVYEQMFKIFKNKNNNKNTNNKH